MEKHPEVGEIWKNNRRNIEYTIVVVALWADSPDENNREEWVVYQNINDKSISVRSMKSWLGTNRNGQKRFEYVNCLP